MCSLNRRFWASTNYPKYNIINMKSNESDEESSINPPIFRPTIVEFESFGEYVKKLEAMDLSFVKVSKFSRLFFCVDSITLVHSWSCLMCTWFLCFVDHSTSWMECTVENNWEQLWIVDGFAAKGKQTPAWRLWPFDEKVQDDEVRQIRRISNVEREATLRKPKFVRKRNWSNVLEEIVHNPEDLLSEQRSKSFWRKCARLEPGQIHHNWIQHPWKRNTSHARCKSFEVVKFKESKT